MSTGTKIGVGLGVIGALTGVYAATKLWIADGSEFQFVRNSGDVHTVATEGWGVAWGLLDRIDTLPRFQQITSVSSENANLRSSIGERFEGSIRVEYSFDLGRTEEEQGAAIETLIERFGIGIADEITQSIATPTYQDPIEKLIQARAQTIATRVLSGYETDEFQTSSAEIASRIRDELEIQLVEIEDLPISIDSIDNSGLAPGAVAQNRIERNAAEQREADRADIIVENSAQVQAAAVQEAEVLRAFIEPLMELGLDEETIVALNCQRLADRNDRFALPFGTDCLQGSTDNDVAAAINPDDFLAAPEENGNQPEELTP